MRPIFISYRRDDTEGQAGRLFDDLRKAFGADMVFMDVATIEPGIDFRRAIEQHTAACGVLLALIGRNWMSVSDGEGHRRLDDPNDFVRLETATALRRDIPLVPVLVQGARMPRAEDLPDDLKDLAFRNSVELTHARWDSDVKLLIEALRRVLERDMAGAAVAAPAHRTPPAPQTAAAPATAAAGGKRRWLAPAAGAAVLVVLAGAWATWNAGRLVAAAQVAAKEAAQAAAKDEAARQDAARQDAERQEAARQEAARRQATQEDAASREAARRDAERKEAARKDAERKAAAEQEAARQEAARREAERQEAERKEALRQEAQKQEAARQEAARQEAARREAARQSQIRAHNDGICLSGFVWREARPGDKVCVTPDVRSRTAAENQAAGTTRSPTGGTYGPNTCKQGYVWREAYQGDLVCVIPSSRQQAAEDNAQAARRVVPLPA